MHSKSFAIFIGIYTVVFTLCAISPFDRGVWWAENLPMLILVSGIILARRHHALSPLSYFFMGFLLILHTIGGHFTFERVPFDFITDLFGFERNHYDRVAHFSVGFYAYPIAEWLLKKRLVVTKTILLLFPVFTIVSVAGSYEIFEWIYAIYADADAGIAVLGSQGDIWDAQKDILADSLGAIFAITVFWILNRKGISTLDDT